MAVDYQKLIFNTDDSVLIEDMKKHNVSQKMLDESLDQLVSYFKMQPHLPDIERDEPRLKRILLMSKYSTEKSKKILENIFTARALFPEYFSNRDMMGHEIKKFIGNFDILIMPKLTPEKYRVLIFKLVTSDIDLYDSVVLNKINYMVADFRLCYETVYDDVYIVDFSLATVQHATILNLLQLKKTTFLSQECYTSKLKAFHLVNVPSYVHTAINICKSLVKKKKILDRIYFHNDMESLHKYIPKDCLPTEFGGIAGDSKDIKGNLLNAMSSEEWRKKFIDLVNEKSDESKRPNGSNKNFDFTGGSVDGSFRSLEID